jgi:hypothetical protein
MAVPNPEHARIAAEATANAEAPITIAVWDKTSSPLAIVTAAEGSRHSRSRETGI